MKEIIAQTFTPAYDALEDRIRLSINYQDVHNRVDFMITRSFMLDLLPSAEEFLASRYAKSMQKETIADVQKQDETRTKTDAVNLELLRTNEELLLEVNFSFDKSTQRTILTLRSKNYRAKTVLDAAMFTRIFQVLRAVVPNIKWGISYDL